LLRSAEIQPLFIDLPLSSLHTTLPLSQLHYQTNQLWLPIRTGFRSQPYLSEIIRQVRSATTKCSRCLGSANQLGLHVIYLLFPAPQKTAERPAIPKCGAPKFFPAPQKLRQQCPQVRSERVTSEQVSWFRKQLWNQLNYIQPRTLAKCGAQAPQFQSAELMAKEPSTLVGKFDKLLYIIKTLQIISPWVFTNLIRHKPTRAEEHTFGSSSSPANSADCGSAGLGVPLLLKWLCDLVKVQ
jgi:hypothetical protein